MSFNTSMPIPAQWKTGRQSKPLTKKQVLDIRSGKESVEYYMEKHNRSRTCISDCQNRRTYKDIE